MVRTRDKKDKNNNNNNNKTKDSSNKRPAQSPSQETSSQGPSTSTFTFTSSANSSAKRTKVSDSETMNIDNIIPPPASQDTASTLSPPPVDTNASPSAPASGKSVEITPSEQERAAFPDALNAAIQSSPVRYYAAVTPHTIDNFWTHYKTNREACDVVDRIFAKYPSYGSKATCQGSGDLKRIIIFFHSKTDLEKAIATPLFPLYDLQFHEHDPSAKKADEQLRTIVVTDIPLFVTDIQLRGAFS
ncbi:hypothetical protein C1646_759245 [Rhizophagus diaphanus]|nr:hypothetical protein C1646_759245 [Rhizophagus diaphanus] [Rhizophagus sp. MUCL 43196]